MTVLGRDTEEVAATVAICEDENTMDTAAACDSMEGVEESCTLEQVHAVDEDDDDDDDDDEDDDAPAFIPPPNYNRGRRTSVSAESMAPTAQDQKYEPLVIPKADEQKVRIRAAVKGNFLFRNLDEEQYVDVVNAMAEKKVQAGEVIIEQGGIGDFFYVVETGNFEVYKKFKDTDPAPVKVAEIGASGSFGELALMYNARRAATVSAVSDGVLWALDRVTFRKILMENTSRKRRMYENFLEEVPLLISLDAYERHKIADALETNTYESGDVVIKQGDVGDNFYIIESGEATVITTDEQGNKHEVATLVKGNYFGELALLSDKPRAATIIAKGKLKCATLNQRAFVRLLGPVVDIIKRNASNYKTISDRIS